jgi:glycosyltransferase involved in cell wall biosynthesis
MTNAEDIAQPLLSILIPVYNGAKYLEHLLGLFEEAYRRNPERFARVEIIVGNNVSQDRTREIAESFVSKLPILRALSLTPHLATAEENIFRYYGSCQGLFSWALGVDEVPNLEAFGRILAWLDKNENDFFLFNFATVSENMVMLGPSNIFMNKASHSINIVDLTQRFGLWCTMAGISGHIVRTESMKGFDLSPICRISPIYAHVIAYLEIFKNKRTTVINESIVFYRVTHADMPHWERMAEKLGVFDEYFWTLGYIRQLEYLEVKGVIPNDYLTYMLEMRECRFFRPVSSIADKMINQLRLMERSHDNRNRLTHEQYRHIRDYLMLKEPFLREFLWKADAIFERLCGRGKIAGRAWKELRDSINIYWTNYIFSPLLIGTFLDYQMFRIANRYYGISSSGHNIFLDRMRFLDCEDCAPDVFAGSNVEEVRSKIAQYEAQSREGNDGYIRLVEQANHRTASANGALMKARHEYDVLRHSTSWKLTWPLRRAGTIVKRLLRAA